MKEIKNVLICGAGMMGRGIAHVLTENSDLSITVYDVQEVDFNKMLRQTFDQLTEKNVISVEEADRRSQAVDFITDLDSEQVKNADLVIECVFEKLEVKQEIFARLEERCAVDTIFCTNTSVISPTQIAADLTHKERLIGTHFWNPAYLIPLVEVVIADGSDPEVADQVMKFLQMIGKKPVLCKKDVPGFIANRMQHALWREAIYIVEQGIADARTVDEAVKNSFGLRLPQLGPMENADMVGIDLTYHIHSYIFSYLCNDTEPSLLLKNAVENNELGFKTGNGFQTWSDDEKAASVKSLNEYLIKMIYHV